MKREYLMVLEKIKQRKNQEFLRHSEEAWVILDIVEKEILEIAEKDNG